MDCWELVTWQSPAGSLELDLLWAGMTPEEALQNAGDPPLASACSWQVHCLAPGPALSASGFLSSKVLIQGKLQYKLQWMPEMSTRLKTAFWVVTM